MTKDQALTGLCESNPKPETNGAVRNKSRQADGAIAEGRIEDGWPSRAFRQIEGKGLRPISLAEGANAQAAKPSAPRKPQIRQGHRAHA